MYVPPDSSQMPRDYELDLSHPEAGRRRFRLDAGATMRVGRSSEAEIRTPDPDLTVSRIHLVLKNDRALIRAEIAGQNGAARGRMPLLQGTEVDLGDGDRITFGGWTLAIRRIRTPEEIEAILMGDDAPADLNWPGEQDENPNDPFRSLPGPKQG